MPADEEFVRKISQTLSERGAQITDAPSSATASNPFRLSFDLNGSSYSVLIHIRRVTPQEGEGTTHARPAGEWHTQMIFDGDAGAKGTGTKLQLRSAPDTSTALFGYTTLPLNEEKSPRLIIAAWDPAYHEEYRYSASLQVKEETLERALRMGFAQQSRRTDELIVAFRAEYLAEYIDNREDWHGSVVTLEEDEEGGEGEAPEVQSPPDNLREDERETTSAKRTVRDMRFRTFIHDRYSSCATCQLNIEALLEAAHIIPVRRGGSDHFSNGMRLCKNCHALFDRGFLIVRPSYEIELSNQVDRAFPEAAERLREDLRDKLLLPDLPEEYRPDPEKLQRMREERWRGRLS